MLFNVHRSHSRFITDGHKSASENCYYYYYYYCCYYYYYVVTFI